MKSFFSLTAKALFSVAIICAVATTSYAQVVFDYTTPIVEENGLSYDISTGTARLWNSDAHQPSAVEIPAQLEKENIKYNVTEMRKSTFKNCKDIQTIIIPQTIVDIQPAAIVNCENLNTIILPERFKGTDISIIAKKCPNLHNVVYTTPNLTAR